jgi:hypothetical protein
MIRRLTIRRMLVLVALAALASLGVARIVERRDFHARAGPSEKLLRPIIEHHEWHLRSDLACSRSNGSSAMGSLSRAVGALRKGVREIRRGVMMSRNSRPEWYFRIHARNALRDAGGEWRGFDQTCRLTAKQQVMAAYHARMIEYYRGLLDEHRVEILPHPDWLIAERRVVEARLREINDVTGVELDPEPLPSFLPGWKPPPSRYPPPVGNSL